MRASTTRTGTTLFEVPKLGSRRLREDRAQVMKMAAENNKITSGTGEGASGQASGIAKT